MTRRRLYTSYSTLPLCLYFSDSVAFSLHPRVSYTRVYLLTPCCHCCCCLCSSASCCPLCPPPVPSSCHESCCRPCLPIDSWIALSTFSTAHTLTPRPAPLGTCAVSSLDPVSSVRCGNWRAGVFDWHRSMCRNIANHWTLLGQGTHARSCVCVCVWLAAPNC